MKVAIEYSFFKQLQMSNGHSASKQVADILIEHVAGAVRVQKSNERDDKNGTDWWVTMKNGDKLSIDCKVREVDYARRGQDDLALESWSVVETRVVGWTRNERKRTDYVLWLWKDTGRWCLIPFAMLCAVFRDKWSAWARAYKTSRQFTPTNGGGYHSEVTFVPRVIVWREIYNRFGGIINKAA